MRTPRQPSQHSTNGQKWSFMDARPAAQGMYDPRNEHDACGVGFVATLTGEASINGHRDGSTRPPEPGAVSPDARELHRVITASVRELPRCSARPGR